MTDALRIDETHLLDDLRRATGQRPATSDQRPKMCSMHDLPYVEGRNGCERCIDLFTPQANATSWKRGQVVARENAWTHEEAAMLRDSRMSDAEISRKTGRSLVAIAEKRKRLKRQNGNAPDAVLRRAWDAIKRHGGER